MVTFPRGSYGFMVCVGNGVVGYISKEQGFISVPAGIKHIAFGAEDLRQIANKVDQICGIVVADHDVVRTEDGVRRPKLVCNSSGCNRAELEMRPGMSVEDWAEAREKFLMNHPCERVKKV